MAKVTKVCPDPTFVLELTKDELTAVARAIYVYGGMYSNEVRGGHGATFWRGLTSKRVYDVLLPILDTINETTRGD